MSVKVRVSAVVVKEGSILLVRHRRRGLSYYALPGGRLEEGESVEECLVREFHEETGYTVKREGLLFVADVVPPAWALAEQVLNLVFAARLVDGRERPTQSVQPDERHDDIELAPLASVKDIDLRPKLGDAISAAAAEGFSGPTRYLGNLWQDPPAQG